MNVGAKQKLTCCYAGREPHRGRHGLACSLQLMLILLLLDLDAALAHLGLMLLALLPQALALSQESLPAVARRRYLANALVKLLTSIDCFCTQRLPWSQRL